MDSGPLAWTTTPLYFVFHLLIARSYPVLNPCRTMVKRPTRALKGIRPWSPEPVRVTLYGLKGSCRCVKLRILSCVIILDCPDGASMPSQESSHISRGDLTDRLRGGRDVAINPGMRDLQQKLEKARSRFSPWSLQKDCGLAKTLMSAPGHQFQTSRLQNRENTFLLFQATQTAIICPSSHRKLKQIVIQ